MVSKEEIRATLWALQGGLSRAAIDPRLAQVTAFEASSRLHQLVQELDADLELAKKRANGRKKRETADAEA